MRNGFRQAKRPGTDSGPSNTSTLMQEDEPEIAVGDRYYNQDRGYKLSKAKSAVAGRSYKTIAV